MEHKHTDAVLTLCGQIGFDHFAPVDPRLLTPLPAVRAMCEANRCGRYDRSWSCPPACGSLDALAERLTRYTSAVTAQTTASLRDSFDLESIRAAEQLHKRRFDTLVRQVRLKQIPCLPLGAGSCTRCRCCTWPDAPCRYPDRLYPSMEACGLEVRAVCELAGLRYLYGPDTITYTSCILLKEDLTP